MSADADNERPPTVPIYGNGAGYANAFPDFVLDVEVPAGFEDVSYQHDTMPSFLNEDLGVRLYINYADPALREVKGAPRFQIQLVDEDERSDGGWVQFGEDYGDVLDWLATRENDNAPAP